MNKKLFKHAYNELEGRMKNFAKRNSEIYVPNVVPHGSVNYNFICMEPSLGEWAKSRDDGKFDKDHLAHRPLFLIYYLYLKSFCINVAI